MYLTRNQACAQVHRGFESLLLRQFWEYPIRRVFSKLEVGMRTRVRPASMLAQDAVRQSRAKRGMRVLRMQRKIRTIPPSPPIKNKKLLMCWQRYCRAFYAISQRDYAGKNAREIFMPLQAPWILALRASVLTNGFYQQHFLKWVAQSPRFVFHPSATLGPLEYCIATSYCAARVRPWRACFLALSW